MDSSVLQLNCFSRSGMTWIHPHFLSIFQFIPLPVLLSKPTHLDPIFPKNCKTCRISCLGNLFNENIQWFAIIHWRNKPACIEGRAKKTDWCNIQGVMQVLINQLPFSFTTKFMSLFCFYFSTKPLKSHQNVSVSQYGMRQIHFADLTR